MHDCSNCGCACYCHGDIDDCVVETAEYSYMHCTGCGCHEDPHEDFDDSDYGDEPASPTVPAGVVACGGESPGTNPSAYARSSLKDDPT